jgi:hypothetical protein
MTTEKMDVKKLAKAKKITWVDGATAPVLVEGAAGVVSEVAFAVNDPASTGAGGALVYFDSAVDFAAMVA